MLLVLGASSGLGPHYYVSYRATARARMARIVRGQVLSIRNQNYAGGKGHRRLDVKICSDTFYRNVVGIFMVVARRSSRAQATHRDGGLPTWAWGFSRHAFPGVILKIRAPR